MEEADRLEDLCRMCLNDLSQENECYAIDDEIAGVISIFTGLSIDLNEVALPLMMCTKCVSILNQFNDLRLVWIENQQKLRDSLREIPTEKDENIEFEQFEYDSQEEYSVEYISEEADICAEDSESIEIKLEEVIEVIEPEEIRPNSKAKVIKKQPGNTCKGKEVYQKLLQKCPKCSKMLEKNRMEGHLNKHLNVRPYICEETNCGKTFFCKLLLRLHRNSIHTDKSLACPICSKTFKSERSLYSHNLRHFNKNRYACNHCERKFNNKNSLDRHLAIHSGVRGFSCEQCSASFYRKFNLDTHIRAVHFKEKSYECAYCPKKFGYARLLREHSRRNHSQDQDAPIQDITVDES